MTLRENITADMATLFSRTDEFAQEVTYTPRSTGTPATINAFVQFGPDERDRGAWLEEVLTVRVNSADVTRPTLRDKVTITPPGGGSEDWYVQQVATGDGWTWKCICTQRERPTVGR